MSNSNKRKHQHSPNFSISPEALQRIAGGPCSEVLEFLHTGIALLCPKGYFLYANEAFTEMYGLPQDIRNKHVGDFFLTAEQGAMTTIRTRKMTLCSSITKDNAQGVSFRYPLLDPKGKQLLGVVIESISSSIDKRKLMSLLDTVKNLEEKADYYERKTQKQPGMLHTFDSIIGESESMLQMKVLGRRFAKSTEPILLFGESGTGKELIAQAIHSASDRAGHPFVTVNCAALPQELMESELFGYKAGAFTGARADGMKGKFELANKGTIFLDEICELPLSMQAKLLRVLESGEIQKIGHTGPLHSDFRLVAASNKNLAKQVDEGTFREDLYHRLNILELSIPPLRERKSDLPLLIHHFIEGAVGTKQAKKIQLSTELGRVFNAYQWRGNIRELKNIITYALYSLEDGTNILAVRHLPERFLREMRAAQPKEPQEEFLVEEAQDLAKAGAKAEKKVIQIVLESTKYNKTLAARVLGISRNKLYKKMRDLGLHSQKS
jgi:Transcriptional regulator containing PAS, AAA-type ATPase, and DNA-binding domains